MAFCPSGENRRMAKSAVEKTLKKAVAKDGQASPPRKLTVAQLTVLAKLAETALEIEKGRSGSLSSMSSGSEHFTLEVVGAYNKGPDTSSFPKFEIGKFLKEVILQYAKTLGADGTEWLRIIMGEDGVLQQIISAGKTGTLKNIPAELLAIWDEGEKLAKTKFQAASEKSSKQGSTTVEGQLILRD